MVDVFSVNYCVQKGILILLNFECAGGAKNNKSSHARMQGWTIASRKQVEDY